MNDTPLVIRIRAAKEQLVASLNEVMREQGLPCYIIEPIVAELHEMVSKSAQAEYDRAVEQQLERQETEQEKE